MSIAYIGEGAVSAGTTSCTPAYPSSSAGDILVLCVSNKHPPNGPSIPSGWTLGGQGEGGSGASGVDAGNIYGTIFYKIADGTESGTLTVTATSASVIIAQIHAFSITDTAEFATTSGGDVGVGTSSLSVTYESNPGITAGDVIIQCFGLRTDTATVSSHSLTCTGVTFGAITEAEDSGSSQGNDAGLLVLYCAATSGTSSAAPVATSTTSASSGSAGGASLLRIREVAGGGGTDYDQGLSATVTRSASIETSVSFGQSMSATVTRSATMSASPSFGAALSAAITRTASMAANYVAGSGYIPSIKRCFSYMKSVISTLLSPVDYGD